MQIRVEESQNFTDVPLSRMRRAAELALEREGIDPSRCEVSLAFVSQDEIREMNLRYRGKDEATDVLSFPMYESANALRRAAGSGAGAAANGDSAPALIGDVVLCREVAKRQAEEIGHSFTEESIYLFVHSIFHLLGYDHKESSEKHLMREAEESILRHPDR